MHIATKSSKIDISKEIVTKKVAEQLANITKKNFTLLFYGNIGIGKTTFIRYFINQLQKKNKLEISEVPSPTFNLIHEYKNGKYNINFKFSGFDKDPLTSLIIEAKKNKHIKIKKSNDINFITKNYNRYGFSLLHNKEFKKKLAKLKW